MIESGRGPSFYNTLSRKKEPIRARVEGKVGMYVCGPTVYDYSHLGHARAYIVFDVLFRFLKSCGYEVRYVRNITDIDDKIITRANETGKNFKDIADEFEQAFKRDMELIGNHSPTVEPRATEHIEEMQALISRLLDLKVAYFVGNDIYFSVEAFPDYGKLSRRNIRQENYCSRVSADERLKSPADFVLWKSAKPNEPFWHSPWGDGRPGWHTECIVMSRKYLGEDFEIHGGGMDLIFPHHENEIAQAEAAYGGRFCRMFIHNGFVNVNREKMSKSLGNFFLIRQVCEYVEPEALRFFLLSTHYRGPIDLIFEADSSGRVSSFPQLQEAQKRIKYMYETKEKIEKTLGSLTSGSPEERKETIPDEIEQRISAVESSFHEALEDDLNTALALGYVSDGLRYINDKLSSLKKFDSNKKKTICLRFMKFIDGISTVMGVVTESGGDFLTRYNDKRLKKLGIDKDWLVQKIEQRQEARKKKRYDIADEIRQELKNKGIEIKDSPEGTKWYVE